jgi:hypothetical protein
MSACLSRADPPKTDEKPAQTPPRLLAVQAVLDSRSCFSETASARVHLELQPCALAPSESVACLPSLFPCTMDQSEEAPLPGRRFILQGDWALSPITPAVRQPPMERRAPGTILPEGFSEAATSTHGMSMGTYYSMRLGSPVPRGGRMRTTRPWPGMALSPAHGYALQTLAPSSALLDEYRRQALGLNTEPHSEQDVIDTDPFSPSDADLAMEAGVSVTPMRPGASSPPMSSPVYAGVGLAFAVDGGSPALGPGSCVGAFGAGVMTGCSLMQPAAWSNSAAALTPLTARLREQSRVAADLDPDFAQVALATNDQRLRIKRYRQIYGGIQSPTTSAAGVSQPDPRVSLNVPLESSQVVSKATHAQRIATGISVPSATSGCWDPDFAAKKQQADPYVRPLSCESARPPRECSQATTSTAIANAYCRFEHPVYLDATDLNDEDATHSEAFNESNENIRLEASFSSETPAGALQTSSTRDEMHSRAHLSAHAAGDMGPPYGIPVLQVLQERQLPNYIETAHGNESMHSRDPSLHQQPKGSSNRKRSRHETDPMAYQAGTRHPDGGYCPSRPYCSMQKTESAHTSASSSSDDLVMSQNTSKTLSQDRSCVRCFESGLERKRVLFAVHPTGVDERSLPSTSIATDTVRENRQSLFPSPHEVQDGHFAPTEDNGMRPLPFAASGSERSALAPPPVSVPDARVICPAYESVSAAQSLASADQHCLDHHRDTFSINQTINCWSSGRTRYAPEPQTHAMVSLDGTQAEHTVDPYLPSEVHPGATASAAALVLDPAAAAELQRASRRLQTPRTNTLRIASKRCRCRRSRCLKKYCDCFAAGSFCGPECECEGCGNHQDNQEQVERARQSASQRSSTSGEALNGEPSASERSSRGCRCKRTGCLKRYCECFQAGRECTAQCACEGCLNCRGLSEHLLVEIRRRLA